MHSTNVIEPLRVVQPSALNAPHATDDCIVVEGHKPRVPAGSYLARFVGHETAVLFVRSNKVITHFEICEGPLQGTRLTSYFRAKALTSKPGPNGKFKLSAGGDLCRMLTRVLDVKLRPDRISFADLRTTVLRIDVRTVVHDREKRPLAEGSQYSVVDSFEDGR